MLQAKKENPFWSTHIGRNWFWNEKLPYIFALNLKIRQYICGFAASILEQFLKLQNCLHPKVRIFSSIKGTKAR
jgi:hypothetical protein